MDINFFNINNILSSFNNNIFNINNLYYLYKWKKY